MFEAPTLKQRLQRELAEFFGVSTYLFVCFSAILFYEGAILHESGQALVPLGFAVGKSLILGKFILLGEAARVGTRIGSRTLLQRIVLRSVALLVLLLTLSVVEELVVGWFHHHGTAEILREMSGPSWHIVLAKSLVLLLVLVPLVTLDEISKALGAGVLKKVLLGPPATHPASNGARAAP